MIGTLQPNAQYANQGINYKRCFIGSTIFLLGNFDKVNPSDFAQFNLRDRSTRKDVISLELITLKYARPLGINPFYNEA